MKSKSKSIIALFLLMMGVVAWLSPILVSADVTNPVISIVNPPSIDVNNIYEACYNVNVILNDKGIFSSSYDDTSAYLVYTYDDRANICNITVNMTAYNKLSNRDQQNVMQVALDTIYNSKISRTNKNKIYNELCALDTATSSLVRQLSDDINADFAHAYMYFKPFSSPIGIFLGFLTIGIFALLSITIVIDIAYITIPFVQEFLGRISKNEKPKFVSLEAANAIREMESKSGQEYVNPLGLYLKSKGKQYIVLAICILYLVSGEIFVAMSKWIDYFSGFLG